MGFNLMTIRVTPAHGLPQQDSNQRPSDHESSTPLVMPLHAYYVKFTSGTLRGIREQGIRAGDIKRG